MENAFQTPREESSAAEDARSARPGEEQQEEADAEHDPDEGEPQPECGGQSQQQCSFCPPREGVRGTPVEAGGRGGGGPGSGGGDDAAPLVNEGCERGCVAAREAEGEAEDEGGLLISSPCHNLTKNCRA